MEKEATLEEVRELSREEKELERSSQELERRKQEVDDIYTKQMEELQRISGLSREDAKAILLEQLSKKLKYVEYQ